MPASEHPSRRHKAPPLGATVPPQQRTRELARACAVGLVTGPRDHSLCAHGKRAAGPGRLPQERAVWGARVPNPGHSTQRYKAPPTNRPCAATTGHKASSQERALWG